MRNPWSLSEASPKSVASPSLSETPLRVPIRAAAFRATQELCRLQRLAQQTFFGTPEAAARVEWAMPVGKPHCSLATHLTTTTLSTPKHLYHPYHPFTTRCRPLPPPPFPMLPPLPSGVRRHAPAARRRRRAETTRRARLHMVERSCPAALQPT